MDHKIKAAIIGHLRNGASVQVVCAITGIPIWEIDKIIERHLPPIQVTKENNYILSTIKE